MGCHRSVVFGSPAKSLRLQDDSSFWHYSKRCKLPEKGQQALKLYVPINIKEVKRGLIFLSPLHCIKKNTHPCKTLSLRVQKTGNAPRVLRHRGHSRAPLRYRSVSHSPFPPSFHSQDGSRSPCLALS